MCRPIKRAREGQTADEFVQSSKDDLLDAMRNSTEMHPATMAVGQLLDTEGRG